MAAAKRFDPVAITLAVTAHVRHVHSEYDRLLAQGWERVDARHAVAASVEEALQGMEDCSGLMRDRLGFPVSLSVRTPEEQPGPREGSRREGE